MATLHRDITQYHGRRFFLVSSLVMAGTILLGFSTQLAMGRSSFAAPPMVHVHALVFFGWTALYVAQNVLAANGSAALHRRLGWLGAGWAAVVVVIGIHTTVMMVRRGTTPFFFPPGYFLFMNSLGVLAFGGLTAAGIVMRRRTAWHRRLVFCGMALLTGPAIGRILPMPLLIPWAAWGVYAGMMAFPIAGIIADRRRGAAVHPAWWWGIATITATQIAIDVLAGSALGLAVYEMTTAGTPGAAVAPLAYPPPPF